MSFPFLSFYDIIHHVYVNRNHSSHFENAKAAFEEGAGHDEMEDNIPGEATPTATAGTGTKQIHITDGSHAHVHPTSVAVDDEIEKVSVDRESTVQENPV